MRSAPRCRRPRRYKPICVREYRIEPRPSPGGAFLFLLFKRYNSHMDSARVATHAALRLAYLRRVLDGTVTCFTAEEYAEALIMAALESCGEIPASVWGVALVATA